jgi:hypothetical protein
MKILVLGGDGYLGWPQLSVLVGPVGQCRLR